VNGIHDMDGFGPVIREANEPVFHADWERRTLALGVTMMGYLGPVDRVRHQRERIDPVTYLTASYYEQWLICFEQLMVSLGWATPGELSAGKASMRKELPFPAPGADDCAAMLRAGFPATRDEGRLEPAFAVGDEVRARNSPSEPRSSGAGSAAFQVGTRKITRPDDSLALPSSARLQTGPTNSAANIGPIMRAIRYKLP